MMCIYVILIPYQFSILTVSDTKSSYTIFIIMKFSLILFCLTLYLTQTQPQGECRGSVSPADPKCFGNGNEGHTYRPSCLRNANKDMWYYEWTSASCERLSYKGCGGNKNRYCSRQACRKQCEIII